MKHRIAFGFNRLLNQRHPSLGRGASALFGIAFSAGTDDIIPAIDAAEHPGDDVVERQLAGVELLAAVLAAVAVAGENIASVEFDGLLRKSIVKQ